MLGQLSADLDQARLPYWFIGGWAVDVHLGRISRDHSDIDIALERADRDAFVAIVAARGFTPVPSEDSSAVETFTAPTVKLEVTYLAIDDNGRTVTPGFEHWPYPAGAFVSERVAFRGMSLPVMSVAALLDTKQRWHSQVGEPRRPHDIADIEALRTITAPLG